ncbi:UDP binding domain-containing protein [Streptomyces sp. NPDC127097]|uniref:UDP binding domain-containing protein n=1 Tax=Streptomyces sp. NPDC127097 TaxID=3347136 RepID=UPI003668F6C9
MLNFVIEANDLQPRRAIQRFKTELGGLKGRRIALLGMTFKAGTDDLREAPSAVIAARLLAESAEVHCWAGPGTCSRLRRRHGAPGVRRPSWRWP